MTLTYVTGFIGSLIGFFTVNLDPPTLAVVLDWGLVAQASAFIVSGLYFASVTIFIIVTGDPKDPKTGGMISIAIWVIVSLTLGFMGIAAAG